MYNRFRDAFAIQQGACNPLAVSTCLVRAIEQCRAEGMDTDAINNDPAVQMIVHQLAHLTNIQYFTHEQYQAAMKVCDDRKKDNGPKIQYEPVNIAAPYPGWKPGMKAQWDGNLMRCPKEGDLYLSGAVPAAFCALNDLSTPYYIAVPIKEVVTYAKA